MATHERVLIICGAILLGTVLVQGHISGEPTLTAVEAAADSGRQFGPIQIPRLVNADGTALPAGRYSVRLTGETSGVEQWVEFLAEERVAGRELATTISSVDIVQVAKMPPPSTGSVRVDVLKDAHYLRVWINDAGTHYLVHLPLV